MTSPAWEDLSDFFNPDDFATEARILREGQEVGKVFGIFEDPTVPKELGDFTLEESGPRFLSGYDAALAVKYQDVLEVDGKPFDVLANAEKDGTGLIVVRLAEPASPYVAL